MVKNVENLADEQIGTQIMVRFELYVYDMVLGGYGLMILSSCRLEINVPSADGSIELSPDGNIP